MRTRALLAGLILAATTAFAQDPAVTTHPDAVPEELAAPLKALVADGGARVTIGARVLDFWWTRGLPLAGAAGDAPAWSLVEEGTLVGVVRVAAPSKDIRGRTIKPGVYTLRYGLQPQNGDHLGASANRDFLLLAPAAADSEAGPTGHDGAIVQAKKTLGTSHPANWSLDPPVTTAAAGSIVHTESGMLSVVVQVPMTRDGKPAGQLAFGLVVVGEVQP